MDPITIATALATVAPKIFSWIKGGKADPIEVAESVVNVAKQVTGAQNAEEAAALIQADPALQIQFKQAIAELDADLEKAYLADTQNARQRDIDLQTKGVTNHRATVLVAMALLLVLMCLAAVIWMSDANEFAKAGVMLILGRALGWVEQVFSFEFGTTRQSRLKDATISKLTG